MTTYLAIFDGWVGFATIKERVRSKVKGYFTHFVGRQENDSFTHCSKVSRVSRKGRMNGWMNK